MAILAGDIVLVESAVMEDVPEGGGGPTDNVIVDGATNNIFPDISELDRAGGRVNMRKVVVHVQTPDRDTFLGSNFIVAEPPNDANVSITIFSTGETFDRREDAVNRIESYLVRGPLWNGLLYENHVQGQRAIQLFQRIGTSMPPIGRTLVLVEDEGLPGEIIQFVRVIATESEVRVFTDDQGDYSALIVSCEISDALRTDFTGTAANRRFLRASGAALTRDTTVADAGSYYGVAPLATLAEVGDNIVSVESVYTQLVPSARTEIIALDQRPAAQREITLAETPRLVTVPTSPHSMRVKVGQENRGFSYVQILKPFPAPGTVAVSFRALGQWYTLLDDGLGVLEGSGTGTVNYTNGSIGITLSALPDVGSSLIIQWGERTAFRDRSTEGAKVRAPEHVIQLDDESGVVPGSVVVTWFSGAVLRTATDDGEGLLEGDAVGEVIYSTGMVLIRPTHMIDPGGEFNIDYDHATTATEGFTGVSVDALGFATLTLAASPAPGTIKVRWITARNVSESSGAQSSGSASSKDSSAGSNTPPPGGYTVISMSSRAFGPNPSGQLQSA